MVYRHLQPRHLCGEDARAYVATHGTGAAVTAGVETGGLQVLRGDDKGWHPLNDASLGVGSVGLNVGGEFTKLYYSGSKNNLNANRFYGYRHEIVLSASLGIGFSGSFNAVYSRNVDNMGGFVIGWGGRIGAGVFNAGAEYNFGASGSSFKNIKKMIQKDKLRP